jgi:hypothetical protein
LGILGGSFRLLAKAVLPLVVLFILTGCGGSPQPERRATRLVRAHGLAFAVPTAWSLKRTARRVVAKSGASSVSATTYTTLKPYDAGEFDRVAVELDRTVAQLAEQAGGKVTERTTTTVDGRKIRAYRYTAAGYATRIGFVLRGRREVQLLCRARTAAGDPDGACALLFETFRDLD